jgi:transposase InsO family protein
LAAEVQRVVVDPNVLISAAIAGGHPQRVVELAAAGRSGFHYRSEPERRRALDKWLHLYNHHRGHTALAGQPPISRINNLPGHYG